MIFGIFSRESAVQTSGTNERMMGIGQRKDSLFGKLGICVGGTEKRERIE